MLKNCFFRLLNFSKVWGIGCLLLWSVPALAQTQNWIKYYHLIDTAEFCITDSNYVKAQKYYILAFQQVNHPFGKDLYNAAMCTIKNNDFEITTPLLNQLIRKGITKEQLEENNFLSAYLASSQWKNYLHTYDLQKDSAMKSINLKLRGKLEQMLKKDQYYASRRLETGYGDSVFYITYRNIKDFIAIIGKYGFPDENMIGMKDLPFDYIYSLILVHFYQCKDYFNHSKFFTPDKKAYYLSKGIDFNSIPLDSVLYSAFDQGKYNPVASYMINPIILLQSDDTISNVTYNQEKIRYLDSLRSRRNLCSMDLYHPKADFMLKMMHFVPKLKSENVEKYCMKDIGKKFTYEFNFGIYPVLSMFFTDKDKDHKHFQGIYDEVMADPFCMKPQFTFFEFENNAKKQTINSEKAVKKNKN